MSNNNVNTIAQFIKFCIIGVINSLVHFSLFAAFLEFINVQAIANGLGFCGGLVCSYFLNAKFTFKEKIAGVGFLRMLFTSGSISVGFGALGDALALHPLLTFIIYILLNPLISFYLVKRIVFRR